MHPFIGSYQRSKQHYTVFQCSKKGDTKLMGLTQLILTVFQNSVATLSLSIASNTDRTV